jgi:hypothetical protein
VALSFEYDEESWAASAGHRPLEGVDVNQVFLLHRHWIWANLQRSRFQEMSRPFEKWAGSAG